MTTDTTSTQQTADNSTETTDKSKAADTSQTTDTTNKGADTQTQQQTTDTNGKAEWGESWRDDYATARATVDGKLDEKARDKIANRLKRFPSAQAALDWAFNADKKISDGSYKKPLSDKATAEEIAEYRKANGIPDDPANYFENLPNGLVIGDTDKPIFESLAKHLHGLNAEPKVMHAITEWYYKFQDEVQGTQHEVNLQAKTAAEDALREEWGADYRANQNLLNSFLGSMPKDLQDELFQSVTADGKQIMNNPKMLQWLATQARELNYTGSVTGKDEGSAKGLEAEIDALKSKMGDRQSDYWKGPNAEKNQARYRDLLEIQSRIKSRAA